MDVTKLVLVIVVASVLFVALLLGLLSVVFRTLRRKGEAVIAEHFAPSQVVLSDAMANFFGVQSKGGMQVRGNGPLVLTKDKLWFRLLVPETVVEIPLAKLTAVRTDKWFLGKTKGRLVVIVDYQTAEGSEAAGWIVTHTDEWVAKLGEHVARGGSSPKAPANGHL